MHTFKYKCGYVHENFTSGMVRVQVDEYAYPIEVRSIHAAKIRITKFIADRK
jgi:hypothetical protein